MNIVLSETSQVPSNMVKTTEQAQGFLGRG